MLSGGGGGIAVLVGGLAVGGSVTVIWSGMGVAVGKALCHSCEVSVCVGGGSGVWGLQP